MSDERAQLEERKQMALRDLAELEEQVENGELDEETAAPIRASYASELGMAEAALSKLGPAPKQQGQGQKARKETIKPASERDEPQGRSLNRMLIGTGAVLIAFAVVLVAVTQSANDDPVTDTTPAGAVGADPCAEMAAAVDQHPGNALRLALAECYLDSGDAMQSITQFRTVLDSAPSPEESTQASIGLGFLNLQIGEVDNASQYMRDALDTDPDNIDAKYWLGMMLVYDLDDPEAGALLLEDVLAVPDLPESVVTEIEEAISLATGGS
jgi:tetratricopeptide (TPR) repeat protein